MDDRIMPTLLFICSILHFFHGFNAASLLSHRSSANNYLQGWPRSKAGSLEKRAGTELESHTINPWKRPRCGVPDYPSVTESELKLQRNRLRRERRKRFTVFGGRWEKTDLTYKIVHFPWQMSEAKVQHVLQEAFGVWSAVTPLRFHEVTSDKADIIIDFNRYWHGDNLPFDGPGGILAHAFFPRTHRQGEVHFDYDEHWTVGNDVGMDLLQVAAHEFGHVLGLQHSLEPGAVMSPFYSDSYPPQLSEDDKRGIQYLYGLPLNVEPQMTETNEIDIGIPDACRTNFDAVSMIRGELFFFKSQYVWRLRERQLQIGYPALASRHWKSFPDHVDAAYEDKSGNIWFFQGDQYWVFDAERKITGPDSVWNLGLPVTGIQAALKWHQNGIEKVYLMKSSSYWSLNPQENRVDNIHPQSMWEWEGVPSHIDAAFRDRHGYANFLSGHHYWRFDPENKKVLEGYPRSIGTDFFGCASFPSN
ncbi:stromelysin-3-like [Takifugu flavidus]|uniref:stromelysin-3-like n=1 Tax=Takifugu flavidus TaxID=433684 RepID=UPI002544ABD2|nr:stromelysin-3-like [Takifugu flavidus]